MERRPVILHSKEAIEYAYTWVISDWNKYDESVLTSPMFETNEPVRYSLKPLWFLELQRNEEDNRFFDIYLLSPEMDFDERFPDNIQMYIILSLVTEQGEDVNKQEKFAEVIFDDPSTRRFEKFVQADFFFDEMNGLVVDGKCTIRCRLYFFIEDKTIETVPELHLDNKLFRIRFDNFEKLLESEALSDVRLIVKAKEFHVHKCILAAQSPVFAAMFEHDMREKNENVVYITDDVEIEVIEELLRFIYASRVKNIKTIAKSLIIVADKYEIEDLKVMCEDSLLETLNTNNVGELLALADTYKASKLKMQTTKFLVRHPSSINGENFNDITKSVSYSMSEFINLFIEQVW